MVSGLPVGEFGMNVQFDLNMANPISYPGDLRSWQTFSVSGSYDPEILVEMRQIILSRPQDNGAPMSGWNAECEGKPEHPAPVVIEWEPLGAEAAYDYEISRVKCPYADMSAVTAGTVTGTRVTLDLPPSRKQEYYLLTLGARRRGRPIGMLMTHGARGHGWDYRFRVVSRHLSPN